MSLASYKYIKCAFFGYRKCNLTQTYLLRALEAKELLIDSDGGEPDIEKLVINLYLPLKFCLLSPIFDYLCVS